MGNFLVTVHAVGNHGCQREIPDGGFVVGCERPGCTDCITREFIRRLKRSGATIDVATVEHWPQQPVTFREPNGQVVDNLATGIRTGTF